MGKLQITKRDILQNFDNGAYTRGFKYYQTGNVLKYDIYGETSERILVHARVQGAEKYTQHIEIVQGAGDALRISSECTCPVAYHCKHAVAVLFAMMRNKMSASHKDKAAIWLEKFLDIQQKKVQKPVQMQEHFLLYRLFESPYDDFEFYKGKILKNGSLSKGTKLSKENLLYYGHYQWKYDYITEEDAKLIGYLKNTATRSYSNHFEGEYGVFVLKKLCETGRCYFRKNDVPLHFDACVKKLDFSWEEKRGEDRLVSNLKEEEYLLTDTLPPLCIDTKENIVYGVETEYAAEELRCLLDAPKFSKEEAEKVTEVLLQRMPQKHFPLPSDFTIEILHTDLKPSLHLYNTEISGKRVYAAALQFFYDDYEISAYPKSESEMVFSSGRRLRMMRDEEREEACRKEMESVGFGYDAQLKGYVCSQPAGSQAAIALWQDFLEIRVPVLQAEGWQVEIDTHFNLNFEYIEQISVENMAQSQTNPWFELSFMVDLGGRSVSLLPVVASLLQEFDSVDELPEKLNLEMEEGCFLHIDSEEIKPVLRTIFELYDKKEGDVLVVKPQDAHLVAFDERSTVAWKGAEALRQLSEQLKSFKGIEKIEPAQTLRAQLREYQQFGLDWLHFLYTFNFGGILADDMGLGKTVQTLAFLQYLKAEGKLEGPVLVVMPTSLIGNWKNEIEKFTPELRCLALYGPERAEKFKDISRYDMILTTYALAQRDKEKYQKEQFFYLILDEAQKIKNPKTKLAVAIKQFRSTHRLALTGTPIENHLGELWSIFDFLMPGFLDTLSVFRSFYQLPVETENDMVKKERLNQKVAPFILRRTKNEVAKELPQKTEMVKKAVFGKKQAALYENIRVTMEKKVREAIAGKGLSRSHITILDALLKLRQVCCHPLLLKLEGSKKVEESAKLDMFLELIDELHSEGRKVLVFSQFTSMLTILEKEIAARKISYTKLTGATRKREEAIAKFTEGNAEVFLISLKAGGVGLNLVAADTVIHYDPWWNPAVENQATDRAYRIGQDKAVFVYKLIIENSIEEQILKLQEKKKTLQEGIYSEQQEEERFSGEDLVALLHL